MKKTSYSTLLKSLSASACVVLFSACTTTAPASFSPGQEIGSISPLSKNNARSVDAAKPATVLHSSAQEAPYNSIDDVGPDAATVLISKANPNKHFVLSPFGTNISADIAEQKAEIVGNDYIKIIGSYFPKVVYRKPQLNSKQLMRVAPGSTFPLEKLDDGWYQISTKQGPGYLRLEDGKPTDAKS